TMTPADLPAAGRLAAELVRMHHALNPRRFLHLENPAEGYARYLGGELESDQVVLVVAERTPPSDDWSDTIVGYAYGRLEPRSYNDLLDAHGKLHDVY